MNRHLNGWLWNWKESEFCFFLGDFFFDLVKKVTMNKPYYESGDLKKN